MASFVKTLNGVQSWVSDDSDKEIQLISIVFGNVLKLVDEFAVHFDVVMSGV